MSQLSRENAGRFHRYSQIVDSHRGCASSPDSKIAEELSDRELDVLKLLARGLTNADIAERLFLSEGTVRNYVSAILAKLDVADRTQAAILALRHGVVGPDEEE